MKRRAFGTNERIPKLYKKLSLWIRAIMAKLLIGSFSIDPIRWCQNNETQSTKSNSRPNHHDHRIMSDSFFQLACVRNCHSFLLQPYLEENQKLLIVVEGHFCSLVHNATSSILFAKSSTFIPGLINSFTSTHSTSIVRDSCCQSIIHHHTFALPELTKRPKFQI